MRKLPRHDKPHFGGRRRPCAGSRALVVWYGEVVPKVRMEGTGKPCRACKERISNRPRGLCWTCYYSPGVRDQFPSESKYARRGSGGEGDGAAHEVLPAAPTDARPGTPEKIAVMQARALAGQTMDHPDDATFSRAAIRRADCG